MSPPMTLIAERMREALAKKNRVMPDAASQGDGSMLEAKSVPGDMGVVNDGLFRTEPTDHDRRAEAWLKRQLDRMEREGGFTELDVSVSAPLAAAILNLNKKNRALKPHRVRPLVAARKSDRWVNTGHPIVISWDGLLQDGQHRLSMVVETGLPSAMDLRFGVDPAAFAVTDIGSKRTGADVLGIEGHGQQHCLAATARVLYAIERGLSFSSGIGDFTNDLLLKFVREHPGLDDAVRIGHSTGSSMKIAPSPVAAAAYLIMQRHPIDAVEDFMKQLRSGVGDGFKTTRQPMPRLRKKLKDGDIRDGLRLAAAFVITFNRQRKGISVTSDQLEIKSGEPFPSVVK